MVGETLIFQMEISTRSDLNKLKFEHFHFQRVSILEDAIACQHPVRLHSEIPAKDYWQRVACQSVKSEKKSKL